MPRTARKRSSTAINHIIFRGINHRYVTVKGQAVACPFIYIMHKCCCLNLRHEVSTDNAYFLRVLTFYRLSNAIVIR